MKTWRFRENAEPLLCLEESTDLMGSKRSKHGACRGLHATTYVATGRHIRMHTVCDCSLKGCCKPPFLSRRYSCAAFCS